VPQDPDELKLIVGRRVAELRRQRRWTQEALAEKAQVSGRYIQLIEAGDENLTIESLAMLANALRIPVRELFERPRSWKTEPLPRSRSRKRQPKKGPT
jgi:transcriptional regulator with XRE-family HTH domain